MVNKILFISNWKWIHSNKSWPRIWRYCVGALFSAWLYFLMTSTRGFTLVKQQKDQEAYITLSLYISSDSFQIILLSLFTVNSWCTGRHSFNMLLKESLPEGSRVVSQWLLKSYSVRGLCCFSIWSIWNPLFSCVLPFGNVDLNSTTEHILLLQSRSLVLRFPSVFQKSHLQTYFWFSSLNQIYGQILIQI